jgi:hypothetical protein
MLWLTLVKVMFYQLLIRQIYKPALQFPDSMITLIHLCRLHGFVVPWIQASSDPVVPL